MDIDMKSLVLCIDPEVIKGLKIIFDAGANYSEIKTTHFINYMKTNCFWPDFDIEFLN